MLGFGMIGSKLIRRIHMYLALFLTPWMLVFALSTLGLNHGPWLKQLYGGKIFQFDLEQDIEYSASFSDDTKPRDIARQILEDLDLQGSFGVRGQVRERLIINRQDPLAQRRITYYPKDNRLTVERERFRTPTFFNKLHFRHGFGHDDLAADLWAGSVDLVIFGMLFWVASGFWMWWEIKAARWLGACCAFGGVLLFGIFLSIL